MIQVISTLMLIIFLSACSFQIPKNDWQRKSTNAFTSYTKSFLSAQDIVAKNDLSRSIKYAKQSADLMQLSKIYLGECALKISAGGEKRCDKFLAISNLLKNKSLDAYYAFTTNTLQKEQTNTLPLRYREFAQLFIKKDYKLANIALQKINKPSSVFLCASLLGDYTSVATRKKVINLSSYYGYKKIVLHWLEESKKHTQDTEQIKILNQKISILKSNK